MQQFLYRTVYIFLLYCYTASRYRNLCGSLS